MAAMDAVIDTRRDLLQKVAKLRETEPNFARFLAAAVDAMATVSGKESLLMVHIEPIEDANQRGELINEIDGTLTEVYRATRAWRTMLERLRRVVEDWKLNPPKAPLPTTAEAMEFIAWLAEHIFTFLGMREYRLDGEGKDAKFVPLATSGLGILEDKDYQFLRSGTD